MLVFETLKNKKSDLLNSNTCSYSRLYGSLTTNPQKNGQIFQHIRLKLSKYRFLFQCFMTGQLWRFTSEMNLMNKNGSWMYQDKEWHIPAESYNGGIEDQDSGDVLGLLDNATVHGSMVDLQDKMRSLSESQRWTRGIADRSGWFKLKNPLSGRVLTAQTSSTLTISGIQKQKL